MERPSSLLRIPRRLQDQSERHGAAAWPEQPSQSLCAPCSHVSANDLQGVQELSQPKALTLLSSQKRQRLEAPGFSSKPCFPLTADNPKVNHPLERLEMILSATHNTHMWSKLLFYFRL